MNIRQLFQKLFRITHQKTQISPERLQVNNTETMQKVLAMLSDTQDVELTCDEVFALLDQFTELEAGGEDVSKLMPLIQHHLNMCADCMDEYKVLKNIVTNSA